MTSVDDSMMIALKAALRQRDEWKRRAEESEHMAALIVKAAGGEVRVTMRSAVEDRPTLFRHDDHRDLSVVFTAV